MLTRCLQIARRALAREHGMTLIELLVTLSAGTVVMLGLFTILDVTLKQTTRTYSWVDATQRSRIATETMENELHSACIADGVTPIQPGSSGTSLLFISQYGNSANVNPVERRIDFNSSLSQLTENTYAVDPNGPAAPNWTFLPTPVTTRTLLTNVRLQNGSTAAFQYFAYQQPANSTGVPYIDAGGNAYMMLIDGTSAVPATSIVPAAQPLSSPLSTTDSKGAAEVTIKLAVSPGGGTGVNTTSTNDSTVDITDAVVLRLTPAANHVGSGANFLPCQ